MRIKVDLLRQKLKTNKKGRMEVKAVAREAREIGALVETKRKGSNYCRRIPTRGHCQYSNGGDGWCKHKWSKNFKTQQIG